MHKHINNGIKLCLEINDLSLLRDIQHLELAIYTISGEKEKSIAASKKLLESYKKVNDSKGIGKTSFLIAQSYEQLGQYDKAMELIADAISYAESARIHKHFTTICRRARRTGNVNFTWIYKDLHGFHKAYGFTCISLEPREIPRFLWNPEKSR